MVQIRLYCPACKLSFCSRPTISNGRHGIQVALDIIAGAIDDAVYLDEDAYNQMIPLQQYSRTVEVGRPLHLRPSQIGPFDVFAHFLGKNV